MLTLVVLPEGRCLAADQIESAVAPPGFLGRRWLLRRARRLRVPVLLRRLTGLLGLLLLGLRMDGAILRGFGDRARFRRYVV